VPRRDNIHKIQVMLENEGGQADRKPHLRWSCLQNKENFDHREVCFMVKSGGGTAQKPINLSRNILELPSAKKKKQAKGTQPYSSCLQKEKHNDIALLGARGEGETIADAPLGRNPSGNAT
jgi:hypothetical protein